MSFNIEDLTQLRCTKTERKCHLIDIAVPAERNIQLKEQEKIDNYSKVRQELKKIRNLSQVVVVPVVIVSLRVISKRLKDWLKKLDVKSGIELLQKAALLGSAKIIRHVRGTWRCWVQLALQEIYRNYQQNQNKYNNNTDNDNNSNNKNNNNTNNIVAKTNENINLQDVPKFHPSQSRPNKADLGNLDKILYGVVAEKDLD